MGQQKKEAQKEPPYYTKTTDFQHLIIKSGKRGSNP
nr:MAG TPA: hypothetical protein [Caudoviricetes sp.]